MYTKELYEALPARYPELRGQVALVTGSSTGVGKGIAVRLAREGMRVVIHGHEAAVVEETVAELRRYGADVTGVTADFTHDEAVDEVFDVARQAYGDVTLLVNNAGEVKVFRTRDVDKTALDRQMSINLRLPFLMAQRAAESMSAAGRGSIVSISSIGGQRAHRPGLPYDMAKGGIDGMTRAMAIDLAPDGIRVNAVAPGPIHTEQSMVVKLAGSDEVPGRVPLGRLGLPVEVGAAVAFLASDDAAYITGQVLNVDGGVTTQLSPPGLWI